MCLIITVTADGIPRTQAGSLTKRVQEIGGAHLEAMRQPRSVQGAKFSLGHGCACELLADDADWNEPYYRLDASQLAALERTFVAIREASGRQGFTVHAAWVGERSGSSRANRPRAVTLDELLEEIRQGRIGNDIEYLVREG